MKRFLLIWTATFFSLAFSAPSSFAYNPHYDTGDHFFSLDLLTQIQNRDVVEKGQSLANLKEKGDADSTRLLVRGGFRPIPSIQLYGLIGGADLSIDEFDRFNASMSVAYGGGIYLIPYQSPFPRQFALFVDAQYLQFTAKDRVLTDVLGLPTEQDEEIRWKEYVAKFGIASDHDIFHPYGGLRFSFVRGRDILSVSGRLRIQEDDTVGVFGGADIFLDPTKRAAFNLEFSLFDVDSISAGLRLFF
ncbi:MAG: hypothetical protein L0Y56_19800 [Nitrospira sp.]|nr:hypothetical protein [Nitrospira sp.]